MKIIYYEQLHVRSLTNQMANPVKEMIVNNNFLTDIDREEFVSAYNQLNHLYIKIYNDMLTNPVSFNLPLYNVDNEKGADKTKSHYLSLIMISFGMCGEMGDEISVDTEKFLSTLKNNNVSNPLPLLNRLSDYGFNITGIDKKRIIDNIFTVDFINNKSILYVIMALGKRMAQLNKRGNRYQLQRLSTKCFEDTSDIISGIDVNDYRDMLGVKAEVIDFFNSLMSEKGYTPFYEGLYRISYQRKKKLTTWYYCIQYKYWFEKEVMLRIWLYNLGDYSECVKDMPESIKSVLCKNTCRNDCQNRHECGKTIQYQIDGIEYKGCRWKTFDFINLSSEDFKHIRTLCENEWKIKNI